jgi:nitrogen regulatory protein P-II 1
MKKIEAFVSPMDWDHVKESLAVEGVHGLIACQASALGEPRHQRRVYRGSSYAVDMAPLLKLELIVADERSETVIEILEQAAPLDTTIVVMSIERAIVREHDTTEQTTAGARVVAASAKSSGARISSLSTALGNAVVHAWRNATC